MFASPNRPFYIRDPEGKMVSSLPSLEKPRLTEGVVILQFIDVDGKEAGPRWILIDPTGGESRGESAKGCTIM